MAELSREDTLKLKLRVMKVEHGRMDARVRRLSQTVWPAVSLELQRLKKRKLAMKDEIIALQERLTPDIPA